MNQQSDLEDFLKEVAELMPAPAVLDTPEYRFHYDDSGYIYMVSYLEHPKDTEYVVGNQNQYEHFVEYKVVDKKLKLIDKPSGFRVKLKSSTKGYPVVKNHAGIILEEGENYPDIEYYDTVN